MGRGGGGGGVRNEHTGIKFFYGILYFVIEIDKWIVKCLYQFENKNYPIYFQITSCSSFTYCLMNYVPAPIDIYQKLVF
jgi:hypothetical protein